MQKKRVKILLLHCLIAIVLLVYMLLLQGQCVFRLITTIPCAGCGLTRAWLAFFKGDFNLAFKFHPLFWLAPIAIFIFAHLKTVFFKHIKTWQYCVIALVLILPFIIIYIIRMVNGSIY